MVWWQLTAVMCPAALLRVPVQVTRTLLYYFTGNPVCCGYTFLKLGLAVSGAFCQQAQSVKYTLESCVPGVVGAGHSQG